MAATFHIKNFDRLQHYKDRSPPWIKLYNGLLDDYAFAHLPDASKAHLLAIGLLASRYSNQIPLDAEWIAKRINATSPVDLETLIKSGFIIPNQVCSILLAERLQDARPEREREAQVQTEKETEIEIETETTTTPAATAEFNEFFSAMPRREGRDAAVVVYDKMVLEVDPKTLLEAAKTYRAAVFGWEQRFILTPVRWLEDRRWTDGRVGSSATAFTSPEEIEAQRALKEKAYGGTRN